MCRHMSLSANLVEASGTSGGLEASCNGPEFNQCKDRMNDEQAEKENASSSIQQAPRSMGVNAPFKRPTLAFKPPLINQPRTTPKDTQMLHASKAAAPSSSAISVAPPTHQTGQRYRVVFLTFENFAKKKKIRKWQDGVLELSDTHIAVLWNEVSWFEFEFETAPNV
jgi:hypothetical protein